MAENRELSDYDVKICVPSGLSKAELAECLALIKSGGAVDPASAGREVPKATSVVIARKDNKIVGVGAIKRIRRHYASDKARKSGVNFPPETPELGYIRIHDDHQRKGLSRCMVKALLSGHEGPLFATTSSAPMKKTLLNSGFVLKGCEWEGNSGSQLSLWLRGMKP